MILSSAINWLLFFGFYFLLINKAGKTFPIVYLFVFTYYVQYIFSTFLIYNNFDALRNYMEINQEIYFAYALPAVLALFAGIMIFNKKFDFRSLMDKINPQQAYRLAIVSIMVSFTFDFIQISGLSSITEYLKYTGALFLLFSNYRLKYVAIIAIYLLLIIKVLEETIFLNLFIWSTYLFFMISLRWKFSFFTRTSFIVLAIPILVLVQSVKMEYRMMAWKGREEASVELFSELAREKQEQNRGLSFWESQGVVRTVGRLTQGWHLGLVLRWVPLKTPYDNGKELLSDIGSSLLPRLLFPDKKVVGGKVKFKKFTGHTLWNGTSMTIGVIGDFYANFGWVGSLVGLFLLGTLISMFLNYFNKNFIEPNPIDIVWLPFIFNYLMRANNDFYMVFNGFLKGILIMFLIKYLVKRIWPEPLLDLPNKSTPTS